MWIRGWAARALVVLVAAAALAVLAPLSAAQASVPVLVLDGTGYGHGVGLSQWGAEYLARAGHSAQEILGTFYPGASIGEATGPVRVAVLAAKAPTTTVTFPDGGEIRSPLEGPQAPGFPVRFGKGGRARITFDGGYRVDPLMSGQATAAATRYQQDPCPIALLCPPTTAPPTTQAPTTTTAAPGPPAGSGQPGDGSTAPAPVAARSDGTVWAVPAAGGVTNVDDRGRSYRGVVEATGGLALRLVNAINVEDYLRGMAEVPGRWPAAAVQAQTVAARTYALRSMQASGELCDDARCQVYAGRGAESAGQDAAVAATTRKVLAYRGALAAAVYSADAGGVSATTLEGFGTPDGVYPYLTTVRYETDNPLPWHLEVGLGDVGARLGYPGTVTGVRVGDAGPSGRALTMILEGTAGDHAVDGHAFARSLGLRSTRFTATLATAEGAPPPPPPAEEAIQVLPAETAAMARRPVRQIDQDRAGPASGQVAAGPQVAGTAAASPSAQPAVPDLDRRRRLAMLLALLAVAAAAGAHVPLLLTAGGRRFEGEPRRARPWLAWRSRSPSP
jgi:SpoIID/LytB domain protein